MRPGPRGATSSQVCWDHHASFQKSPAATPRKPCLLSAEPGCHAGRTMHPLSRARLPRRAWLEGAKSAAMGRPGRAPLRWRIAGPAPRAVADALSGRRGGPCARPGGSWGGVRAGASPAPTAAADALSGRVGGPCARPGVRWGGMRAGTSPAPTAAA